MLSFWAIPLRFHSVIRVTGREFVSIVLSHYDLFFFDCDGLLIDSEKVHYEAFLSAFAFFGLPYDLDYLEHRRLVGKDLEALKAYLVSRVPEVNEFWDDLYLKKHHTYIDLVAKDCIDLMPGVPEVLACLKRLDKKAVVVTNASRPIARKLMQRYPCLSEMDWVTRELYSRPKPAPDAYMYAYDRFYCKGMRVIGFEDSVKGLSALSKITAVAVFVNAVDDIELPVNAIHIASLKELVLE
ncbi:MAG: HAD family phosphatase [Victivallaceae bacterium]